MEIITKYRAFAGSEFSGEHECDVHEVNCNYANAIISELEDKPDNCEFSNGGGYIQHDLNEVLRLRIEFLEFCKRYTDHKWIQETINGGFDVDSSWAGRIIGECAPNSIYKVWYRFSCIGKDGREWGQPYYVANPDKATDIRLNK